MEGITPSTTGELQALFIRYGVNACDASAPPSLRVGGCGVGGNNRASYLWHDRYKFRQLSVFLYDTIVLR